VRHAADACSSSKSTHAFPLRVGEDTISCSSDLAGWWAESSFVSRLLRRASSKPLMVPALYLKAPLPRWITGEEVVVLRL
jgi:hypothetical protein